MLKIGLIGGGWHATRQHAPALRHCAGEPEFRGAVELAGVCDVDRTKAEAAAAEFGFGHAYSSIEAMLPHVDAVLSILQPMALLSALPIILRRGRDLAVLIEKPLGTNLDEARRLAQLLDGRPHMVSLNRRFDPAVVMARAWMAEQSPPQAIHGLMARHDRRERDFTWGTGIHLCDLMCFLVGPLRLVGGAGDGGGVGKVALLSGADDLRGTVHIHPACGRVDESVQVFADDWAVEIVAGTHQPWRVRCWKAGREEINAAAAPDAPEFERNGTAQETRAFLRAALGRAPFAPTVAEALPGTELAASLQAWADSPK